jgi:hypothetical protein
MKSPFPGSDDAIDQGCLCPVLDNCHGKGFPVTTDEGELQIAYWMNNECPLHGLPELRKAAEQEE